MPTKKNCLSAAVLALVFLSSPGALQASPVPDYPFVHVSGSAFRPVLADMAALDFEIVAVDADPAVARATIEARVAEVRALTDHLTMERDDVAIREVRQSIVKGQQSAAGGPLYELRCDVHINVRNLSNWAMLAGGLYGKPNLSSYAASFDITNMDQVTDELVTTAIADARHHAEVIAAASGRRVGAVMGATPEAIKNLGTAMGLEREEFRQPRRASNTRTELDREELMAVQALKLRQSVDVLFRLENLAPAKGRAAR